MLNNVKDYFLFSKKERIGIIVLLILIAIVIAIPYLTHKNFIAEEPNQAFTDSITKLLAMKPQQKSYQYKPHYYSNEESSVQTGTLFTFNPNTLDERGWKKLGLRDKTVRTILNYTSKGGRFKTPEDIRKIWGLQKEEADKLIPYIVIEQPQNTIPQKNFSNNASPATLIDVNTATAQDLRKIPNIGNSIPYKIINYREKLGGFLNMAQVKEAYGMTDSIFSAILPYLDFKPITVQKININTASDYDLGGHPYITKTIAKAIVIYRNQHGSYTTVKDLRKIVFLTQEVYDKMAPYLTTE